MKCRTEIILLATQNGKVGVTRNVMFSTTCDKYTEFEYNSDGRKGNATSFCAAEKSSVLIGIHCKSIKKETRPSEWSCGFRLSFLTAYSIENAMKRRRQYNNSPEGEILEKQLKVKFMAK